MFKCFPIFKPGVTLLLEFMRPFDNLAMGLPPHHVCVCVFRQELM